MVNELPSVVGQFGGTFIYLYPSAFIDFAKKDPLTIVIRTKRGLLKKHYLYIAVRKNYTAYTTTDEDLSSHINIDAEVETIFLPRGLKEVLI